MMNVPRRPYRKIVKWLGVLVALAAAGIGTFVLVRAQRGFGAAKSALRQHHWDEARRQLDRYLWLHPDNAQARLLLAEAYVRDDQLTMKDAVAPAILQLKQIPKTAENFATARLQEGRLTLLILRQPARAELLLREATQADPENLEASLLLWRVLDMTGRQALSAPCFGRFMR